MKKTFRTIAVAFVGILAMLGVMLATTSVAEAKTYTRSHLYLSSLSTQKYVGTTSGYGGTGTPGYIKRGHRLAEGVKVKSVYVPKGCLLIVNGRSYYRGWVSGNYANIGKSNFKNVKLLMICA
jgi:hypothetical protein